MANAIERPRHLPGRHIRPFSGIRNKWTIVGVVAALLIGLLGIPSSQATTTSWQQAVEALAGTTPARPSSGSLVLARSALDPSEPSRQVRQRVADAANAADTAYLGDGTRFLAPLPVGVGFASQASATTALARELKRHTSYDESRTAALVGVLSATIRTARTGYTDAARLVGKPTAANPTSVHAEADSDVDDAAPLQENLRGRCQPSRPAGDARRFLGLSLLHVQRMDEALKQARPRSAVREAAEAYLTSYLALRAIGVDPLRNGSHAADTDRDQLPDSLELVLGANPLRKDSDRDGIDDGVEATNFTGVLRLDAADTDGDGVRDGLEDLDGDGLTNKAELGARTDPLSADTDNDGLSDSEELSRHTKPNKADTDNDGLSDGVEVRADLNPRARDTDQDGVPDGKEIIDQPVSGPDGVKVEVRSIGDLSSSLQVRKVAGDSVDTKAALGRVGDAYDFVLDESPHPALMQARITLPFDPAALPAGTDTSNLRVFYFDEGKRTWVPATEQQNVDAAAHTVSVTVGHFSRYALFDIANWQQQWTSVSADCTPGDNPVPVDVALAIDSSGSMVDNDPEGLRKTAAKSFVDALNDTDRAGVVDFDGVAVVRQALTIDKDALKQAIDAIDSDGGTDIGAGTSAALGVLPEPTADRANAVILLTDGQGSWNESLIDSAAAKKTVIFTIGLSASADTTLLQHIADATGGKYFGVSSADQLPQVFRSLSGCVKDPTPGGTADPNCQSDDTDKDGLPDCVETGGYALGTGKVVTTKADNPDTDGDGVPDGQEAGTPGPAPAASSVRYYAAISDPTMADTDGDGLDDADEIDALTDPWAADSDHDGLADPDELGIGTDPRDGDTDGDSLNDGYELTHVDDQGLDPLTPDERTGKWEYVKRFVQGALCGDVTWSWAGCGANDSLARLAGSIMGSFIPFIDVRDVIANLVKADFVGVGLSLVGLVPFVGDAADAVAKVVKYVRRFPAKTSDAIKMVANFGPFNRTTKVAVLDKITPEMGTLRNAGMADADIVRVAKGAKNQLADLTAALQKRTTTGPFGSARVAVATRAGTTPAHRVAEQRVQELYQKAQPGWTPKAFKDAGEDATVNVRAYRNNAQGKKVYYRESDIIDNGGKRVEIKSGYVKRKNRNSDVCEQARKDREDLDAQLIPGVLWHFVPSARSTAADATIGLGPSAEVLSCLTQYSIPFVIHLP
jgi:von Willebrand factor type A domain-containing protein/thrombospondin type 3 repeat protein